MPIGKLHNVIQPYAWGSVTAIPKLLGQENLKQLPQAELWMGVHPLGCSQIETAGGLQALDNYIDNNAIEHLGEQVWHRFGQLPYLLKVLAAAQPLSLQAHPNKQQAERGWQREQAAGLPLSDRKRNYKDDNHKPEILLAITPFVALSGLRSLAVIKRNLQSLLPQLNYQSHRHFFSTLMSLSAEERESLLMRVREILVNASKNAEWLWVKRLHQLHPNDVTILAPLYLNLVQLQPGQALYSPASVLHAYLEGTGIELMANSDNVLRGGLTAKHCDLKELLQVLDFSEQAPQLIAAKNLDGWRQVYPTTAAEFLLQCWQIEGLHQYDCVHTPTIIFLLEGQLTLTCSTQQLKLQGGDSAFISAEHQGCQLQGQARLVAASVADADSC